jgi:hypothetical protein
LQFGFTRPLESASHTFERLLLLLIAPEVAAVAGAAESLTVLTIDENISFTGY